jgi:hypothetical protein
VTEDLEVLALFLFYERYIQKENSFWKPWIGMYENTYFFGYLSHPIHPSSNSNLPSLRPLFLLFHFADILPQEMSQTVFFATDELNELKGSSILGTLSFSSCYCATSFQIIFPSLLFLIPFLSRYDRVFDRTASANLDSIQEVVCGKLTSLLELLLVPSLTPFLLYSLTSGQRKSSLLRGTSGL